jgi:hypothetical protein
VWLFDDFLLETLDKRDYIALFGLGHLELFPVPKLLPLATWSAFIEHNASPEALVTSASCSTIAQLDNSSHIASAPLDVSQRLRARRDSMGTGSPSCRYIPAHVLAVRPLLSAEE